MHTDRLGLVREYQAWGRVAARALDAPLPRLPTGDFRALVLSGMGGSGAVCEVMRDWLTPRLEIPVAVVKDYHLPRWVPVNSLVIAVSCSGDTEETISVAFEARQRDLATIAISGGGVLGREAESLGIAHVPILPGLVPRSSFPQMFLTLASVLQQTEVVNLLGSARRVVQLLKRMGPRLGPSDDSENPARRLATGLHRGVPVVYCAQDTRGVGLRFAASLNENAKMHALAQLLPELCHNEVVAWERPLLSQAHLLLVRLPDEFEEMHARFEAVKAVLRGAVVAIHEVWGEDRDRLASLVGLVYLLDYVSLYCALLRGIDPGPTKTIDRLKQRMASFDYLRRRLHIGRGAAKHRG